MNRPVALGGTLALIIGIGYLGILGAKDNPEYGKEIIVPAKVMTTTELKGIRSYIDRDCAYCHNILGRGGRGEGADLSNVVPNERNKDWLVKYIKEPKSVLPRAVMPGYDLKNDELEKLAAYMLSLDFDRYGDVAIGTNLVEGWSLLHQNNCLSCHQVNGVGFKTGHDLSAEGAKRNIELLSAYFQKPSEHTNVAKNDGLEKLDPSEADQLIKYLSTLNK
jgi:mono/diheme cytochrome c family protein